MKHEWERFLNLLKLATRNHDNYMEVISNLNPGCTDVQIKLLEKSLDVKLPKDFSESLMIHNGQSKYGIFEGLKYLNNTKIINLFEYVKISFLDNKKHMRNNTDNDKYYKNFIPISEVSKDYNLFCIDLNDSNKVISFDTESLKTKIITSSFKEFFKLSTTKFLEDTKTGKIDFK